MLNAMRRGAQAGILKFFLMGFFVLAVAGLVLMDVGGFFRGGVSQGDVAKIGGDSLSPRQFDRTVRRVLASQGIDAADAYKLGFISMILNREIYDRLLYQQARNYGIVPGDALVSSQIARLAAPLTDGETGSKKDALKQILFAQGISESEFITSVDLEMTNNILRAALTGAASAQSGLATRDLYQYENEKRTLSVLLLENDKVTEIPEITQEALEAYYQLIRRDFVIPESRSLTLVTLKKEMLERRIEITEEEIRAVYDGNPEAFRFNEKRTVEQAILATQSTAEDVVRRMKKKRKDLAKTVSAVTSSKDAYVAPTDFEKGSGLLPEVEQPVFDANKDEVLGPIQTPLGWHVLIVRQISPPGLTPFEEASTVIRSEILQERLLDDLIEAANQIDDRLAGGEELDTIIADFGLTSEKIGPVRVTGLNEKKEDLFAFYGTDKNSLLDLAFSLDEGEISPVTELPGGRFVVVRADQISPQGYRPYEDVKTQVQEKWIAQQKALKNSMLTQESLQRLNEGLSLEQLAKELNVKIHTFSAVGKNAAPEDIAPMNLAALDRLFDTPPGDHASQGVDKGYIIGTVQSVDLPDVPDASRSDEETLAEIGESLRRIESESILSAYLDYLKARSQVSVNEPLLARMYAPADSSL